MSDHRTLELCGPRLRPCEGCGGVADYACANETGFAMLMVVCTCCGRRTRAFFCADAAAEDWNHRITAGARVVTLDELQDSQWGMGDDAGDVAVWIEGEGGTLRAAVLSFGIDLGDLTVHEHGNGRSFAWSPRDIQAEGVSYRLWDKKPTKADRAAAPWGPLAWKEARLQRAEATVKEALGNG